MAEEIELKLRIAPEDAARLRRLALPGLAQDARAVSERLYSVYYDTPELALRRQGLALRLRRLRRRWVQTVKAEGSVAAGLHRRSEWESPVAGERPEPERVGERGLRRVLAAPKVARHLKPLFVTDFTRSRRLIAFEGGDLVELALDRGEIRADGAADPVCEIELELKQGSPQRLYELALAIARQVPVRIEPRSKAERGYALHSGLIAPPRKAGAIALAPEHSVNRAFRAIAQACLEHLQANEEGTLAGRDVEYLHQMRVALRRLRSAFGLFMPLLTEAALEAPLRETKWLTSRLGPARDWDVFMTETLPRVPRPGRLQAGFQAFERAAQEQRDRARGLALDALRSQRYQTLLLTLGAWLASEGWMGVLERPAAQAAGPVRRFARQELERGCRRVAKRGRRFARLPAEERHRLRIAAKKLRYAGEFFYALQPGKRARAYLKALGALQDALGVLNDAATTDRLLKEIAAEHAAEAELVSVAGFVDGWVAADAARRAEQSGRAWKAFRALRPYWRKK